MADRRRKDVDWFVTDELGVLHTVMRDGVTVALLMDIRDELKRLNEVFHCNNFLMIPSKIERIARNTHKPRRKRKVG